MLGKIENLAATCTGVYQFLGWAEVVNSLFGQYLQRVFHDLNRKTAYHL